MALFSPPVPTTLSPLHVRLRLPLRPQSQLYALLSRRAAPSLLVVRTADDGAATSVAVQDKEVEKVEAPPAAAPAGVVTPEEKQAAVSSNGSAASAAAAALADAVVDEAPKFKDPRWVNGTWDLGQFQKNGSADWDAVIDAEARRRKWLEDNPETTRNDDPVIFDTSIIPWWAWMKRFHLPEAELLNGRAAMVGFFMAYFVDSLTGVGLVDQMGNFFCKTLLLVAVVGVLAIRKNEDIETVKKLIEESTFYDKQWQATWQEDETGNSSKP